MLTIVVVLSALVAIVIAAGAVIRALTTNTEESLQRFTPSQRADAAKAGLDGFVERPTVPPKKKSTASVESTPCASAVPEDDGFATSMLIGMATDNAIIGGLVGGNMAGGIVGDLLNDGQVNAFSSSNDSPSASVDSYSSPIAESYDSVSPDTSFDSGSDFSGGADF